MSCLSNIKNAVTEKINQAEDAVFSKLSKLEDLREAAKIGKPFSVALIATGVVLGILGIAVCASGGFAAIVGATAILAGLSACYFGYNGYQVMSNLSSPLNRAIANGGKTFSMESMTDKVLKKTLAKNTFCFDWAIDLALSLRKQ